VRFSNEERRPTDLDVIKSIGAVICFEARLTVLVSFGRMLTMFSTLITVFVGILHLISKLGLWCDDKSQFLDPDLTCVGPLLFWSVSSTNETTVVDDRNAQWREVIGLTPAALANNFAPLIMGIMMTLGHRKGSMFQGLLRSWYRVSFLCLFVALFAGFGFAGNAGVVAGFVLCGTAIVHLFVALLDSDVQRPFLEFRLQLLAPENANDSADSDDDDHRRHSRPTSFRSAGNDRSPRHGSRHSRDHRHRDDRSFTSSDDSSQSGDEVSSDDVRLQRKREGRTGMLGMVQRQMSSNRYLKTKPVASDERRSKDKREEKPHSRRRERDTKSEGRGGSSRSRSRGDGRRHRSGDEGGRSRSSRPRDSSRSPRDDHRSSSSHHRHVNRS
jgi:hypothetical protein